MSSEHGEFFPQLWQDPEGRATLLESIGQMLLGLQPVNHAFDEPWEDGLGDAGLGWDCSSSSPVAPLSRFSSLVQRN